MKQNTYKNAFCLLSQPGPEQKMKNRKGVVWEIQNEFESGREYAAQ